LKSLREVSDSVWVSVEAVIAENTFKEKWTILVTQLLHFHFSILNAPIAQTMQRRKHLKSTQEQCSCNRKKKMFKAVNNTVWVLI
jgi:hypothetical protein